ncbi:MAG TPA: alanine racemase [Nocardioidaceae bacterium]|nr:alanine racemase [Nocardioidaceae bacterium]
MLSLYVDEGRWTRHQQQVVDAHPGLVPVAKGNGYGFGLRLLAEQATRLGVDTIAVGTYPEIDDVAGSFDGTILVLTPWRPTHEGAVYDERVVHTVGRLEDLEALAARDDRPRVALEMVTSMRRHGFTGRGLREAGDLLVRRGAAVRVEGAAVHLPLPRGERSHLDEMDRLMTELVAADLPAKRVFVSHLDAAELETVRSGWGDFELRPRIGTALWLGDPGAYAIRASVLEVHRVGRGDVSGYRARRAPRAGHLLVVSGGTSHSVGLEAPTPGVRLRDRAARLAAGGLDAAGLVRSPYTVDGARRLFAEPPHMQVSMLFVPDGVRVPRVGDELDVRLRMTIAAFDRIVLA